MKGLLRMTKSRMMFIQKIGAGLFAGFLMLVLCVSNVQSMTLDTGNPDLAIRLDNTAKYSTSYRLHSQSGRLISDANKDDGNRAFDVGFISNRFDLLTEFDIVFKRNFGARISTAMWYDSFYLDDNDNNSPATANIVSGDHDHFTDDTEKLHGKDAEILDAFVFANTYFGNTSVIQRGLQNGRRPGWPVQRIQGAPYPQAFQRRHCQRVSGGCDRHRPQECRKRPEHRQKDQHGQREDPAAAPL